MKKVLQFRGKENILDLTIESDKGDSSHFRVDVRINFNSQDKLASYYGSTPGRALGNAAGFSDNVMQDVIDISNIIGIATSAMFPED